MDNVPSQGPASLTVRLIRGIGLANADANGLSDPYCKLWVEGLASLGGAKEKKNKKTSAVKKDTLDPEWDEKFNFDLPAQDPSRATLYIEVWDKDPVGSDSLGGCIVDLYQLHEGVEVVKKVPVVGKGELELGLTAHNFDSSHLTADVKTTELFLSQNHKLLPITSFTPAQAYPRYESSDPAKFFPGSRFVTGNGTSIQLFLDKTYYLPGEILKGHVEFICTQPIEVTQPLVVQVKGKMKAMADWFYIYTTTSGTGKNRTTTTHYIRRRNKTMKELMSLSLVLGALPDGKMGIGRTVFPFTCPLPAAMASSSSYAIPARGIGPGPLIPSDIYIGHIGYKVVFKSQFLGIKIWDPLVVTAPASLAIQPLEGKKEKSFAFYKGKLNLTVGIANASITPGEVLKIHVKVDNKSSAKVHGFIATVHWVFNYAQIQHDVAIVRQKFKFDAITEFDGVVGLEIPATMPITSDGIMECSNKFYVTLEADVPGACDPKVAIELRVNFLPPPGQQKHLFEAYNKVRAVFKSATQI